MATRLRVVERFPRVQLTPLGEGVVKTEDFIHACRQIGYKGYFAYEICTPFHVDFRRPTLADIDRMTQQAAAWLREKVGGA